MNPYPHPPQKPERALIIAPSWIGDAVMMQALLIRLKEKTPSLIIEVFANAWIFPLLKRMPEVSEVIENPFAHGEFSFKARRHLAKTLSLRAYTQAFVLPNSFKSALIPFLAGIPLRVGFTGEARYGLLNCRHHLDKKALPKMVSRFLKLAELPDAPLNRHEPRLQITSSEAQQNETRQALSLPNNDNIAVLCPGAEYGPAKRWPSSHFARLAQKLITTGWHIWLLGSHKDQALGEAILESLETKDQAKAQNLCGKTTLDQAIDLIAQANVVVCNDSGLMHIASALHRPLIALYGSSSPEFTPPLSHEAAIVSLELSCRPCFQRSCPLGHLACLHKIEADQVLSVMRARSWL